MSFTGFYIKKTTDSGVTSQYSTSYITDSSLNSYITYSDGVTFSNKHIVQATSENTLYSSNSSISIGTTYYRVFTGSFSTSTPALKMDTGTSFTSYRMYTSSGGQQHFGFLVVGGGGGGGGGNLYDGYGGGAGGATWYYNLTTSYQSTYFAVSIGSAGSAGSSSGGTGGSGTSTLCRFRQSCSNGLTTYTTSSDGAYVRGDGGGGAGGGSDRVVGTSGSYASGSYTTLSTTYNAGSYKYILMSKSGTSGGGSTNSGTIYYIYPNTSNYNYKSLYTYSYGSGSTSNLYGGNSVLGQGGTSSSSSASGYGAGGYGTSSWSAGKAGTAGRFRLYYNNSNIILGVIS